MVKFEKVPILGKESIHVGYDIHTDMVQTIINDCRSSTYVVVNDTNLSKVPYCQDFVQELRSRLPEGSRLLQYAVKPGEANKTRSTKPD